MPTFVLFLGCVLHLMQGEFTYQNNLNSNGLSVVCKEKECARWEPIPNVSFIDPDSLQGKVLSRFYQHSFPIVIWQDKRERVIFPSGISPLKINHFITNWKNYHASDTP